jgi:hypothetical protein
MSAVFDNTGCGRRLDPYWWTQDWTPEQKQIVGDPKNRIGHMERTRQRIDADKAAHPDNVFGPDVR